MRAKPDFAAWFVTGLVLLLLGALVVGVALDNMKEGETNNCYTFPADLTPAYGDLDDKWTMCYNSDTEQYIQCEPIEVKCR